MGRQEQIDAIKIGLAALDSAIAQASAAMSSASTPDDIRSLSSTLVDLRSERSRLQAQLNNLEAAGAAVGAPGPVTAVAPLKAKLNAMLTDRATVKAALTLGKTVHGIAKQLRAAIGGVPTEPIVKPRSRTR
jgi:hypothetical protein